MNKITLTARELMEIVDIVKCNSITEESFVLIQHGSSGIGYVLDMEFPYELNNMNVTVRANITNEVDW
jgi:hypothetical protein